MAELEKHLEEAKADNVANNLGREEVDKLQIEVERLVREHAIERSQSHEAMEAANTELKQAREELGLSQKHVAELEVTCLQPSVICAG